LKVLWKEYGARDYAIPKDLVNERWELKGLLESQGDRTYQFTDLAKIPVGALPLVLFNQVQELLLLSELAEGVTRELRGRADNGLRPYTSQIKVAFMGGFTG